MNVADQIREQLRNSHLESFTKQLIDTLTKRFQDTTDTFEIKVLENRIFPNFKADILNNTNTNVIARISDKDVTYVMSFLKDNGFVVSKHKYVGTDIYVIEVKLV